MTINLHELRELLCLPILYQLLDEAQELGATDMALAIDEKVQEITAWRTDHPLNRTGPHFGQGG